MNTKQADQAYVAHTYARFPVEIVSGRGSEVFDETGKRYIDLTSGIGVDAFGVADPAWIAAVTAQLGKVQHISNLFYTAPAANLAQLLCERTGMKRVFFSNSGAEANECAIKAARKYAAQTKGADTYTILTLEKSFHGRTLATLSATGQSKVQKGFDPLLPGFAFASFNDLESVKAAVTDKTVAVMLECVQGEGGCLPATEEFVQGVRALCDEKGLLMLCDEIQCGMGRTGAMWAFEHYGVKPDAFTAAKSLGGGLPLGALVASPALSGVFTPGSHGSTFGGNPVACAASLAVFKVYEDEKIVEHAAEYGELFRKGLEAFVEKYDQVLEVRGKGLLLGLVLKDPDAQKVQDELRMGGLLACVAGPHVVRFLPPLNMTESDLEEGLEMIGDALDIVYGEEE